MNRVVSKPEGEIRSLEIDIGKYHFIPRVVFKSMLVVQMWCFMN